MQEIIKLSSVSKRYVADESETHALAGIEMEIRRGEYVSISRPSCQRHETQRAGAHPHRESGFIFQAFKLIGDLTVYENVASPLTYGNRSAAERKKAVCEALERVSMGQRERHYPSQLSGSPAILLADEPTGNLDSQNGEQLMNLLEELHQGGATICMVTHDPRFAQCSIRLFDGRIVEESIAATA